MTPISATIRASCGPDGHFQRPDKQLSYSLQCWPQSRIAVRPRNREPMAGEPQDFNLSEAEVLEFLARPGLPAKLAHPRAVLLRPKTHKKHGHHEISHNVSGDAKRHQPRRKALGDRHQARKKLKHLWTPGQSHPAGELITEPNRQNPVLGRGQLSEGRAWSVGEEGFAAWSGQPRQWKERVGL